jgi:spoIIIJ-associated protein
MRRKKEFIGKDLNEALAKAATRLDVHQDEVHYRFIDEGRRGIMGLGARDVRIEVELPEAPAADRPPQSQPKQERNRRPRRQPKPKTETTATEKGAADKPAAPEGEGRGRQGKGRSRSGRKGRNRGGRRPGRDTDRPGNRQPRNGPRAPQKPVEADPAQMEQLGATLRSMIGKLQVELEVAIEPVRTGVRIELTGDQELLVRNDAEFPQAIQFLLNRMSRRTWPDVGRIQVVSDGFRNERDEELMEEIREVAGQVIHTGQAKALHPMNPYERRIVHITIREFEGLRSESEGEGFRKRITITKVDTPAATEDA